MASALEAAAPGQVGRLVGLGVGLLIRGGCLGRLALLVGGLCLTLGALQSSASADLRQTDLQSLGSSGGNGVFDVTYAGASRDGTKVFFRTGESLAPADTDTAEDLYMRENGVTTLLSVGPAGGNSSDDNALFGGISADGSYVFFSTTEQLTSNDTDAMLDAYQWNNGAVTLVTVGPVGGNGAVDAFYLDNSDDGTKVFFDTNEKLTSDDTDAGFQDVYQNALGTTTRVSMGLTGGNANVHAFFLDPSADGSHVLFQTGESLVSGDADGGYQDVYDRSGGTTTLVSGVAAMNGAFDVSYGGATPDVSHVVFSTREALVSGDTDTNRDLYAYTESTATTALISTGAIGGNGAYNAFFAGVSADGSKFWFETREPLVSGDTDSGCLDAGGNPVLTCTDVYQRSAGSTTLVSCCSAGSYEAFFSTSSQDGSKVFFRTPEALVAGDADGSYQDIYQRSGGTTTLISTGPAGGNGPHDVYFGGTSADGSRIFFQTNEPIVAGDTDGGYQDVYERYSGGTSLVSTGPTTTNAGVLVTFGGSSQDGTKVFFETDEALTSADADQSRDAYSSTQTVPGFPRPKGASPAIFPLVPAYQPCTSGNVTHGAPLAYSSCAPPAQESGVLTVGSPDANVRPAASVSSVKLKSIIGATGPPEDSNVQLFITVSDVLCRAANAACGGGALSDYTGKVLVEFGLRLTDKYSGSPLAESATTQDLDMQIPVQCAATAANEGGKCQTTTTVNALYPGAVLDTKRANWEVGQLRVLDAGPNGTGFGSGCPPACGDGDETVFMRQGIFIP